MHINKVCYFSVGTHVPYIANGMAGLVFPRCSTAKAEVEEPLACRGGRSATCVAFAFRHDVGILRAAEPAGYMRMRILVAPPPCLVVEKHDVDYIVLVPMFPWDYWLIFIWNIKRNHAWMYMCACMLLLLWTDRQTDNHRNKRGVWRLYNNTKLDVISNHDERLRNLLLSDTDLTDWNMQWMNFTKSNEKRTNERELKAFKNESERLSHETSLGELFDCRL